jgi:putative acetyltransferase
MLPEVLPLRHASRELVRELGFLQNRDASTKLSHSHCHALIEIESRGSLPQVELPPLLRLDKSTTSRVVAELEARAWVRARTSSDDKRARILTLTAKGREKVKLVHREANGRVEDALRLLGDAERAAVLAGMQTYARALERARRRAGFVIRPVAAGDRAGCTRLIRAVMPEFGAVGPGYAINDPEVDDMFGAYQGKRTAYFVVVPRAADGRRGGAREVHGGGGFGPLRGGDGETCELRKMYFLPALRGLGLGQEVLDRCFEAARRAGFRRMYLETIPSMTQARALYDRNGFVPRARPLGATGHYTCNTFMLREL